MTHTISRPGTPSRRPARRPRRGGRLAGLLVAAGIVAGGVYGITSALRHAAAVVSSCTAGSGTDTYKLSPDQAQNASIIAAVGLRLGMPDHAVTVALATALQESGLVDLTSGDRDSVGLFQQRPSEGWGTPAQLLDPTYASTAFYDRLRQVPGWQTMPVTQAAQAVQLSAAPSAYANWEGEGRALAIGLTGERPAVFTCHLGHFSGAPPQPGALEAAATQEAGSGLLGASLPAKTGWTMASWAVGHAWQYHIARVTFGAWTWTASSGKWRSSGPDSGGGVVSVAYG